MDTPFRIKMSEKDIRNQTIVEKTFLLDTPPSYSIHSDD